MKKIVIYFAAIMLTGMLSAQSDPVSKLIDEYTGKDGFIAITLTGDMMKMAAEIQEYKSDTAFESKLNEVKLLVQEKSSDDRIDFYSELYDKLDKNVYKELIKVKEEDEDITMLAKESNGVITEFILIVGGDDENVLIHATGEILIRELGNMAAGFDFKGFDQMKLLDR